MTQTQPLLAGSAVAEITPTDSQFLFGYPHVERYSSGVHDRLWCSALYLSDGATELLFLANDIVNFTRDQASDIRRRIAEGCSVPAGNIFVTATHTHSGPKTCDTFSNAADTVVPPADPAYVNFFQDRVVAAGLAAVADAGPAEAGLAVADATGVGTNRRDPSGPRDPQVPVLAVRRPDGKHIAVMTVYAMHPTVMHEDSTLVSGDFPGMARLKLQESLGADCAVVYHTGASGNQSPRHVVTGQTFAEAERLGGMFADAVAKVLPQIEYRSEIPLAVARRTIEPPPREMPDVDSARAKLDEAIERLEELRRTKGSCPETRTAECDWFGAQESLVLAEGARDGRLDAVIAGCSPAEVIAARVGDAIFLGWPGECFVEYALEVRRDHPQAFICCYTNGGLQGYIVTPEAAAEGGYEASNALFAPATGSLLAQTSQELIEELR
jgi:neutral ceramidase